MKRRLSRSLVRAVLAAALVIGTALGLRAALPRRDVTTGSPEAYCLYQQGRKQSESFRLDAADSSWAAAVALDPDFAMAWARRGFLAFQRGQLALARSHLIRADSLADRVSSLEAARIRWYTARISGDATAERAAILAVLRKHPSDVEALLALCQNQLEAGETEAAIGSLRAALAADPGCVTAFNTLGYALADLGRFEEALEAFRKYAFVNSDEPNPHDSLGELYERIGRYAEAEAEYTRAIAADSSFYWAYVHRARMYCTLGRYRDAVQATQPDFPGLSLVSRNRMYTRSVMSLLDAGRPGEALRMIEAGRAAFYQPAVWFLCRGAILKEMGRADEVDAMRDSLLRRLSGDGSESSVITTDFLRMSIRSFSFEARGEWGAAADTLRGWLGRGAPVWDTKQYILLRLADDLNRAGRSGEALAAAARVLRENPVHPEALCLQARALETSGRIREAVESWQRAAEVLEPADPDGALREEAWRKPLVAGRN